MSEDSRDTMEAAFNEVEQAESESVIEVESHEVDEITEVENQEVSPTSVDNDIEPDVSLAADDESGADTAAPIKEPKTEKAPQSWTPADRESWAGLPENVKTAVLRREQEIGETMKTTSQARHFQQDFSRMAQPYQGMFQAQGVDTMTGINNVLQTAATLQGGNVQQKAQAAAQLIRDFGIDIATLDDLIVGNIPQAQPQVSPEIQQLQQQLQAQQGYINQQQQGQQQQQQQAQQAIQGEVQAFMTDPKNEFAADVKPIMRQFMQFAAQNGENLSLDDAYNRAISTRPDLIQIKANRANGQSSAQALSAARNASVSIAQNGKTIPRVPGNQTSREDMLDAWNNLS